MSIGAVVVVGALSLGSVVINGVIGIFTCSQVKRTKTTNREKESNEVHLKYEEKADPETGKILTNIEYNASGENEEHKMMRQMQAEREKIMGVGETTPLLNAVASGSINPIGQGREAVGVVTSAIKGVNLIKQEVGHATKECHHGSKSASDITTIELEINSSSKEIPIIAVSEPVDMLHVGGDTQDLLTIDYT